jgi:hypothetical protein
MDVKHVRQWMMCCIRAHRGHFEHLLLNFHSKPEREAMREWLCVRNFGVERMAVAWKEGFHMNFVIALCVELTLTFVPDL